MMLFCGGSVLLSYHTYLGYLPDFDLAELAGLMASVTLIGLLLIAAFLLSCFVPGLALRWLENRWPLVPYRRYIHSRELIVLWCSSVAIWAVYLLYSEALLARVPFSGRPFFAISGVAVVSVLAALLAARKSTAAFSLKHWKHRLVTRLIVAFPVWTLLCVLPIGAALTVATSGNISAEIPMVIMAVGLLTMFNTFVYAADVNEIRNSIGVDVLVALLVICFALGLAIAFPQAVMQMLALGHKQAATLTLSGKSCHSLARFGVHCAPDSIIELENINVLSRTGTTVLLELLARQQTGGAPTTPPAAMRENIMSLSEAHRRLYCMPSPDKAPTCSACDARILQRAQAGKYRSELVCVKITIPKDDIVNIVFGGKRQYAGYSGFSGTTAP